VEVAHRGAIRRLGAGSEVILSLGAIHTPKVLMRSGIGDEDELRGIGIPVSNICPASGEISRIMLALTVSGRIANQTVVLWSKRLSSRRVRPSWTH
jgi:choline dehydrogenase-like flavoprotein